jgi:hypothetical protein
MDPRKGEDLFSRVRGSNDLETTVYSHQLPVPWSIKPLNHLENTSKAVRWGRTQGMSLHGAASHTGGRGRDRCS